MPSGVTLPLREKKVDLLWLGVKLARNVVVSESPVEACIDPKRSVTEEIPLLSNDIQLAAESRIRAETVAESSRNLGLPEGQPPWQHSRTGLRPQESRNRPAESSVTVIDWLRAGGRGGPLSSHSSCPRAWTEVTSS